jgi:thiamine-monophosphate kinase
VDHDRIGPEGVPVISVSDEGEFGLIRRIVARLPATPAVLLGPGDDAAVLAAADGRVVVTTDVMVEGRHFRHDWSSGYDVGRKAAAANLADVVAMGARPTAIVVGLATPGDLSADWVDALADGLRDECSLLGAAVVGGDVVGSDTLTVAVTALGDLEGRAPLTRSGARPGDLVVLAGRPGRAAAGLALLRAGRRDHPLADAHRRPEPSYQAALGIASSGRATAMIDVSDGLVADLGHVALASGVRIELTAGSLPVDTDLVAAAELLDADPVEWVASGGDDHCFAATVAADAMGVDSVAMGVDSVTVGFDAVTIGTVTAVGSGETPAVTFTDRDLPRGRGHEHFR